MTRFGIGYDVHRLAEGRRLIIGGVDISYEKGLLGHSDADVLLHVRVCGGTQGFAHRDALGAVVAQNAHFNQFVRRQGGIGFFDNGFGQALLADHDHGIEMMGARLQFE